MQQITHEMLQVVAEYDGWELKGEPNFIPPYKIWIKHLPQGTNMIPYISPSGKEYDDWAKQMKYATSMDWLHPVAMKVLKSLQCEDKGDLPSEFWNVVNCCSLPPINGQYIDLFKANYEAILFIKQNKETCNTN